VLDAGAIWPLRPFFAGKSKSLLSVEDSPLLPPSAWPSRSYLADFFGISKKKYWTKTQPDIY
jgi:hypothetical protein